MPFNLKKLGKWREWKRYKRQIPKLVANDGVHIWLDSFKKEGFVTDPFEKWKDNARSTKNKKIAKGFSKNAKKGKKKLQILVESGDLKRAVSDSVHKAKWNKVEWRVKGIPYAEYHNEGTGKDVVRRFMGHSKVLDDKVYKRLKKLDRLFKGTT